MRHAVPIAAIALCAVGVSFALVGLARTPEPPAAEALPAVSNAPPESTPEPTAYDDALRQLNRRLHAAERANERHPGEWLRMEGVVSLYIARAHLTGDHEDYLHAER